MWRIWNLRVEVWNGSNRRNVEVKRSWSKDGECKVLNLRLWFRATGWKAIITVAWRDMKATVILSWSGKIFVKNIFPLLFYNHKTISSRPYILVGHRLVQLYIIFFLKPAQIQDQYVFLMEMHNILQYLPVIVVVSPNQLNIRENTILFSQNSDKSSCFWVIQQVKIVFVRPVVILLNLHYSLESLI